MRKILSALCGLTLAMLTAGSGQAGNIALTGHDSDFHYFAGSAAGMQISAMIAFARSGAPNPTKPVLTFDAGSELTSALTSLGIPFTNVNPNTGVPAASLFDVANFSAIAVASDQSCGGCDNSVTSSTNIAGASGAIAAFFNAGGGIVAFAGGSNLNYYAFVPASASGFGSPPSSGYLQTAYGASLGIPPVNGNATHNFFYEPGTGGVSAAYGVVERLSNATTGTAETIACAGCTIAGGGLVGGDGTPPAVTIHSLSCPVGPLTTDVAVSQTLTSTLPAPVAWSVITGSLPPNTFLSGAGVFSGTPNFRGNYTFVLQGVSGSTTVTQHCALLVSPPVPPASTPAPVITSACPLPGGTVGTPYTFTLTATGATPITWTTTGGALPNALALAASTGVLSGTPTHPGTFSFTVGATNSGGTTTQSCSAVIAPAAPVTPVTPVITTACPATGLTGSFLSRQFLATGTTPISWSSTGGALPSGLSFSPTGLLLGTFLHPGTYTYSLAATNSSGSGILDCVTVVTNPAPPPPALVPPTITTACPLPNGTIGVPYSQALAATGGTAPLVYSITSGVLPSGLSLSAAGVISGSPVIHTLTFPFTLKVTDAASLMSTKSCSITIVPAPLPPAALTITTVCPLPTGGVGQPYSVTLGATGGTTPYTWSISAGALPTPQTVSAGGVLSGAPYHPGTYNFTLRVADSASNVATQTCSSTIMTMGTSVVASAVRGRASYEPVDDSDLVPFNFELESPLDHDVNGRVFLIANRADGSDPAEVAFSTGGRTVDFTISAGETKARFAVGDIALLTAADTDLILNVLLDDNGLVTPVELVQGKSENRRRGR